MTMNDEVNCNLSKVAPPTKRRWRWLRRIAIVLAIVVGIYVSVRFIYPVWIQARLPKDAPRIAFSLDNTLLAKVGITDATYQRVMAAAGGRLIKLRPDAAGDPEVNPEAVKILLEKERIDGILLTGGGDVDPKLYGGDANTTMLVHRLRDDFEIALIRAARERGLPMLGICRGCQILNIALGGTVRNLRKEQDVKDHHLVLTGHAVELEPGSKLAETLGVRHLTKVISLHGNAVGEPGGGVRIAATGPGGVIEAIEAESAGQTGWIVGIQWHPELTLDDQVQQKIYQVLVGRAREVRKRRVSAEGTNPVY
ncbi:MAG: gamma-glutamyl-gamma-aminobutyrate hydrolase family protein [Planctomycetota bacterium]|nr:MAG: gamma-glutamyl-gamma-aminobutyrate hydrolase family protein [Planctomycetota bacterium]